MKMKKQPDWEMERDCRDAWESLLSDLLFGMCNAAAGDEHSEVTFSDSPRRERAARRKYGEKYDTIHDAMFELVEMRRDEDAEMDRNA